MLTLASFILLTSQTTAPASQPAETPYTFAEMKKLIEEKNVDSIENLLPLLPSKLRQEYVMMYASNSIQTASPEAPRVIAHSDRARFIYAFNGGDKKKDSIDASDMIEVIQFNDQKKAFEFYAVEFQGKARPPKFLGPNPQQCASCHSSEFRPNWEDYFVWHGAFGSIDDLPEGSEDRGKPPVPEDQYLTRFKAMASTHPRYKSLLNLDKYFVEGPTKEPNTTFTHRLFRLNYERLAQKIRSHPDYEKRKYQLALALDLYFLMPEIKIAYQNGKAEAEKDRLNSIAHGLAEQILGKDFDSYLAQFSDEDWKPLKESGERNKDPFFKIHSGFAGRYVFEKGFGWDPHTIFTNFESGPSNQLNDGIGGTASLLAELVKADPDLQKFFKIHNYTNDLPFFRDSLGEIEVAIPIPLADMKYLENELDDNKKEEIKAWREQIFALNRKLVEIQAVNPTSCPSTQQTDDTTRILNHASINGSDNSK